MQDHALTFHSSGPDWYLYVRFEVALRGSVHHTKRERSIFEISSDWIMIEDCSKISRYARQE